jgi:hypothetical protein
MPDKEWTVRDLTEALKQFPTKRKGLLRDGIQ